MPKLDVERLIKVVGLLASNHDGERASAARMASDLLRAYNLTWEDVFRSAFGADRPMAKNLHAKEEQRTEEETSYMRDRWRRHQQANPRYKSMNGTNAADILRALKIMPRGLTDWDRDFVDQVIRKGGAKNGLTEKQWVVIFDLANKAGFGRRRA